MRANEGREPGRRALCLPAALRQLPRHAPRRARAGARSRGDGAPRRALVTAARIAFAANWLLMSRLAPSAPGALRADLDAMGGPRFLSTVVRLPTDVAERLAALGSR